MDVNRERNKEKLNFGLTCTKYILFLLNVVFVIASVLAISSGISTIVAFTSYYYMMAYGFNALTTLWLVVGIIFLIVALVGIFTAFKESTALSNIYGILIMVVFVWQIAVSAYSFSFLNQTQYIVTNQLKRMMIDYSRGYQPEVDWIQLNYQCCGINDPSDWQKFDRYTTPSPRYDKYDYFDHLNSTTDAQINQIDRLPVSCCEQNSNYVNLRCDRYHKTGCFDPIHRIVSASVMLAGTFGLIFSILQFLGIVLGFHYARLIRGKKTQLQVQIWNTYHGNSASDHQETDYDPMQS
ncbi:CD151 antigen-like isoform X1 [Bradysia coprophila]|uniref:CD151 antigen-like isoform X1 n=1 Tax=Bradysia coprophila TaxID=38358 RepID=UPI00187DD249|nr:CD151 antigen-like isoform X1 [Bradysia coprophila]